MITYKNLSSPFMESKRYTIINKIIDNLDKVVDKPKKRNRSSKVQSRKIVANFILRLGVLTDFSNIIDDPLFFSKKILDKHYDQKYVDSLLEWGFYKWKSFDLKSEFINALDILAATKNEMIKVDCIYKSEKIIFKYSNHESKYGMGLDTYNRLKCEYTGSKFEEDLFVLITRYLIFGDNNQSGMPRVIKESFRHKMGIEFECFASALNHHFSNYCSLFYDIEQYFGSKGPFTNKVFNEGVYMANPPYEETLLLAMIDKMIASLESATGDLTFIFGLPQWDLKTKLTESKFAFEAIVVKDLMWENLVTDKLIKIIMETNRCIITNNMIPKEFYEVVDEWVNL